MASKALLPCRTITGSLHKEYVSLTFIKPSALSGTFFFSASKSSGIVVKPLYLRKASSPTTQQHCIGRGSFGGEKRAQLMAHAMSCFGESFQTSYSHRLDKQAWVHMDKQLIKQPASHTWHSKLHAAALTAAAPAL